MDLMLMVAATAILQAGRGGGGAGAGGAGIGILGFVCYFLFILAITVPTIAGLWKIFDKAGQPGWAAIVPVYNTIILLQITEKPTWWVIVLLCPCTSIVFSILVCLTLAEKFGKSAGFGIGLALLGPIFAPILGFGSATYQGGGGRDSDEDDDRPRRRRPRDEDEDEDDDRPRRRPRPRRRGR